MQKDYYKTLGVDKSASADEIKKAFRKLAHEYHPDKGTGNEAKFKEASEAYSVLSDDKKRAQYDQFGSGFSGTGAQGGYGGFGGQGFGGFNGFDFSQFTQGNGQGFEFDLGDVFGDFFGGNAGRRNQKKRGSDIQVDLELSFAESVFGVDKTIYLTKNSVCKDCQGSGAKTGTEMYTCGTCSGRGKIKETRHSFLGSFVSERLCDKCHGAGKVPKEKCHTCDGRGITKKQEEIKVKIPADIDDGETVRLPGAGEAISGGTPGDLYIKIHVKEDRLFHKEGSDLVMNLRVKLSDALLGAKYPVKTLDGDIELKIPEGVAYGEILRIKGKGIPKTPSTRGDLLIQIDIETPNRLSRTAKKLIEELKKEGV